MTRQIYYTFSASAPPAEPTQEDDLYIEPIPYPVGGGYFASKAWEGSDSSTVTRKSFERYWTPEQITTQLWLDASDETTITKDGSDLVSEWRDKSGNNRHATASGGTMPTFDTNKIVLTQDEMFVDATFVGNNFGVFVIASINNTSDRYARLFSMRSNLYAHDYDNTSSWLPLNRSDSTINIQNYCNGLGSPSYSVSYGVLNLYSSMMYSNGRRLFANGIDMGFVGQSGISINSTAGMKIGQSNFANDENWDGDVCETIITYDNTDAIRQKIEGYLAHKWDTINDNNNLKDLLPVDHPYKTNPPTV